MNGAQLTLKASKNKEDVKKQIEQIFNVDLSDNGRVNLLGVEFTKEEIAEMQKERPNPVEDEPLFYVDESTQEELSKLFRVDKKIIPVAEDYDPNDEVVYVEDE